MAFEYNNIHFTLASDSLSNWQKINPTILNNEIIIVTNEDNNPPYLLLGNGNKFIDLNTEENQIFLSKTDLKKTVLDDLGVLEFKGIIKNVPTEVGNKGDVYIIGPVDTGEQKDYYWYIYTDKGWQEVGNFSDIPQSDWDNDTSPLSLSFIKNKPRIRSGTGNSSILASSARWAMGDNSFAAGRNTMALGQNSWSIGNETAAVGDDSFSEGQNTIANGNCQHVQGTYNLPTNADSDYLHIIGNGISNEKRSNAYTLDKYGNAKYSGNIIAHDSCDYKHISVRRNIEEYTLLTEEPSNWKDKYSRFYTKFEDGTKYIARINPEDEFEPNKYYSTKTYSLSSQIGVDRDGYIELLSWAGDEDTERLNQIRLKKDGEIELFKPLPISSGGTGVTSIEDLEKNLNFYKKEEVDKLLQDLNLSNDSKYITKNSTLSFKGITTPIAMQRTTNNVSRTAQFGMGGEGNFWIQYITENGWFNALSIDPKGKVALGNARELVATENYVAKAIANLPATKTNPKAVILDTDFGGDIDDLPTLAILLQAERLGMVDIIGIVSSVPRQGTNIDGIAFNAITAMDAVCNYYGVEDMAFGADLTMTPRGSSYCATACTYKHTLEDDKVEDSPIFYRRALASLPEGEKCDIAITGSTIAFSRFLNSGPDDISSLTGLQLAAQKIDTLYIMGGKYPEGMRETNFAYNAAHTNNILTNYPNKIIFIGFEQEDVHCGNILLDNNMTHSLLYKCFNEFMISNFNNGDNQWGYTTLEETWHNKTYAWDCLTVLLMCQQNYAATGFDLVQGKNSINTSTGVNTFTPNNTGNHYYVVKQQGRDTEWFTQTLDSLLAEYPLPIRTTGRVRLPRI